MPTALDTEIPDAGLAGGRAAEQAADEAAVTTLLNC
jgi:hypothetical protein